MKLPSIPTPYLIAGAAVGAALLWVGAKGAKGAGAALAAGAVDLADGVISEPVLIVGEVLGVPRTNQSACERAKAEGRTLDASFQCPAGDFIRYWWNK